MSTTALLKHDELYTILGLHRGATSDELKRAYRRYCVRFFPDRNDKSQELELKRVQLAYEVLSDPWRRRRYDSTGDTSAREEVEHDFSTFLQIFFPHGSSSLSVPRKKRMRDPLQHDLLPNSKRIAFEKSHLK